MYQGVGNAKTQFVYCREMVNIKHGHEARELHKPDMLFSNLLITLREEGAELMLGSLADRQTREGRKRSNHEQRGGTLGTTLGNLPPLDRGSSNTASTTTVLLLLMLLLLLAGGTANSYLVFGCEIIFLKVK